MLEKRVLLISIATILFMGCLNVLSSSAAWAYLKTGDALSYSSRHLIYLILSILFFSISYWLGTGFIKKFALLALFFSLALLGTVLIPGLRKEINFSKRWIDFFGISFQPSSIALSGFIIYSSCYFANLGKNINKIIRLIPHLIITLLSAVLIYLEPDFGSAVILVIIGLVFYFLAGVSWKKFVCISLPILIIVLLSSIAQPYRVKRIISFLNPDEHASYQVTQSLEAIRAGGLLGQGIGKGKARLLYLPYSFSDFSFSVFLEETGFLGGLLIYFILGAILYSGLRLASSSRDLFSMLYGSAVVIKLCLYAFINAGVSLSLLPAKGLPFPFLSYGGTFLLVTMAEMGFLLSIGREK
ncbi:MAG: putative peptidoglycan glycosyltransferase FtsW [candidate division WS2 bacterium]|nr:putative peptidoglycan glycosyltransferase FtsW [Candidatus Lithacetigena glycinireducens]